MRVQGDRAAAQRCVGEPRGAAQQRAQAREQLLDVKRLDEIVVGARLQAFDLVLPAAVGGENEHGVAMLARAQRANDVDAGELRQAEIHHRDVDGVLAAVVERLLAVAGGVDGIALGAQPLDELLAQRRLVLDDQHAHGGSRPGLISASAAGAGRGCGCARARLR